jgi:hypothetical protein
LKVASCIIAARYRGFLHSSHPSSDKNLEERHQIQALSTNSIEYDLLKVSSYLFINDHRRPPRLQGCNKYLLGMSSSFFAHLPLTFFFSHPSAARQL